MVLKSVALLTAFCLSGFAQENKEARAATATIGDYNAPGAKAGRVSGGMPFSIVLTASGPEAGAPAIDLKGTGKLQFHDLRFDGTALTGSMTLQNSSAAPLRNARLQVTSVTEHYIAKDKQGKETEASRTLIADMASPISFGDVATDSTSSDYTLTVAGFRTTPATKRFTVHGVVLTTK